MEHGNQGTTQSTTEETNNSKEEEPPDQAVSQQEMSLILSMPQNTGMRTPPGRMERESPSHAEDKCPPFSLETELLTGPQSAIEIGSGDNMKGSSNLSSSQDLNPQLSVSELNRTQGLKEEAQNSKEEEISAQTALHLEMSLFMPMQAIIRKLTSRGNVRVPRSSKCTPFPVNLGCSSGPQSDTEKGSGDTLQTAVSFLDNTTKSKESDNIKKEEKTLGEESVILNVDPVTVMEPEKETETCATQTEEASTLLVSHKAVQIPEETSLKAQDPGNELQSPDPFWFFANISGLIEKEEQYIEDHVNRPKKRHMDLQEHLDQK
uniref:Uncharacterized protein LOC110194234 n=1 Tax=Phascolarctos cinereus TaxID=38626 RepID=A0A6P5IIS7_PHACI|nr:uncharacterized protein LOC110194234 [Phascolarctos cinereus]